MAVGPKRLSEAEKISLMEALRPLVERQQHVSRRTQALLASAGEAGPARRWYVLRLAPKVENDVDKLLEDAGVERWLPVCEVLIRRRSRFAHQRPEPRKVPVWPGYIFVRVVNSAYAWAGLARVKGVLSVLGSGEHPAPVDDDKVLKLKMELERDEEARDVIADAMKPGQRVRVTEGPFASFEGIVEELRGFDRAAVEVHIFGRACLADLDLAQLAKIG